MLTWSWLPWSCSYLSVCNVITAEYSRTIQKVFNLQFDFLLQLFNLYSIQSQRSLFAHPQLKAQGQFCHCFTCTVMEQNDKFGEISSFFFSVLATLCQTTQILLVIIWTLLKVAYQSFLFYPKKVPTLASALTFARGTSHLGTTVPSITCCSFYLCITMLHQCLAVKFAFWLSSLSYAVL